MKVGAGNAVIKFTDELLPVEGFIGIHDLPKLSAIYIEDKGTKSLLISVEIVMLWDDFIEKCRNAAAWIMDVTKENVWLHVTHAISTPHAPGGPLIGLGGDEPQVDEEEQKKRKIDLGKRKIYEDAIFFALIDALKECKYIKDASLFVGTGKCQLIQGRDIRTKKGWWIGINGDGESNQTMTILSFKDNVGNYIGGIVSYGMKPCAIDNSEMEKGTRLISADAPGMMCRALEDEYNCPIAYITAAAGDRLPIKTAWYDELDEDGAIRTVDLGVKKGIEFAKETGAKMAETATDIIKSSSKVAVNELKINQAEFIWKTKGRVPMQPYNELTFEAEGEANVPVGTLIIGNVALVAGKPEINVKTEQELKAVSGYEHTLYLSMINGGMKYMPDRKSYDELRWEALASMLMPGAAEEFVKIAADLLRE